MNVAAEFEKHDISIDDVRWYLASEEAKRLLTYRDDPDSLARLIHSGRLEAEWYRMDERYTETLQEQLENRTIDGAEVRKIIGQIERAKRLRFSD